MGTYKCQNLPGKEKGGGGARKEERDENGARGGSIISQHQTSLLPVPREGDMYCRYTNTWREWFSTPF